MGDPEENDYEQGGSSKKMPYADIILLTDALQKHSYLLRTPLK